jgi:ketosteroid isomerase-like protein
MIPSGVISRVLNRAQPGMHRELAVKSMFAIVLGLLLCCTAALADDQADVRDFIKRYDAAYVARDETAIRGLVAKDYRVIVKGMTKDFATSIAEFTDPKNANNPTALSSTVDRIHVAGDLAVAVGTIQWTEDGKSGGEHFTLVLRREGGAWRAVEEHISEVEEDAKS